MAPSIEDRISKLETREKAISKDLLKFMKENVDLQTKICELKGENLKAEENLMEMSTKSLEMKDEMQAAFSFKEEILKRLSLLESNVESLVNNHDRLSSLETVINDARQEMQEMTRHRQSVTERLDEMDRGRKEFGPNLEEDTNEETQPKERAVKCNVVNQEEMDYRQSVAERLDGVEMQIGELMKDADRLNNVEKDVCIVKEESTRTGQTVKDSVMSLTTQVEALTIDGDRLNNVVKDVCIVKEETTTTRQSLNASLETLWTQIEKFSQGYPHELRQWASRVVVCSSEYGHPGWGANQILGEPKVFPRTGDVQGTWSPCYWNIPAFIEVGFSMTVRLSSIHIYETLNPGSVVKVKGREGGGAWTVLWQTENPARIIESRIFSPPLSDAHRMLKIDQLRIELDMSAARYWSELDAVQIVGSLD